MTRNLEARVDDQLSQASKLVSRADFARNSAILTSLKTVIGTDIITYSRDGAILATTMTEARRNRVSPIVMDSKALDSMLAGGRDFVIRETQIDGLPYKIAYRPLPSIPGAFIAVLADTSDVVKTRNTIAKLVFMIAAFIVVLMSLIGHAIAKGVTGPALRLVELTKKVAAGERTQKAALRRDDEIGVIAEAFNEMVEQLRKSEEKALRSEKLALTGLLAARVAHEVRNPLSAIKMQAQLLRSKIARGRDDSELELIVSVLQGIDRVEWVVRGMLNLASPQEPQLRNEDVLDVLNEVLDQTGPQLRHRKIAVRKHFEPTIPKVPLDRDRFKLALLNLIVNASEAMTNGGVLELSACNSETTNSVRIEIADDGEGIDPSVRDRLFDPFVTTKREGVGLGLVNTKNIVEQHHGTIRLSPRDGRGTRAIIELPAGERVGIEQVHG